MDDHNKKPHPASAADAQPLQVMIYEESIAICKEIAEVLRSAGYSLKAAHLKDATQLAKALNSGHWDLIIGSATATDSQLQQLGRTLASHGGGIPLLVAMDTITAPEYARALRAGAWHVLVLEDADCTRLAIQQALSRGRSVLTATAASHASAPALTDSTLAGASDGTAGGHDLLTGLFSHQYLVEIFDAVADERTEGDHFNALMYIKLDRFDDIHRDLGNAGSGLIIADLGNVIREALDAQDIPIRIRDATFAVLVSNKTRARIDAICADYIEAGERTQIRNARPQRTGDLQHGRGAVRSGTVQSGGCDFEGQPGL